MKQQVNILICCTGSVATIKLPLLLDNLIKEASSSFDVTIKYCLTEKAQHFCSKSEITLCEGYTDQDEWSAWSKRGDPVLHIDLSKWADILIIAPLDANTLAKIANVIITLLYIISVFLLAFIGGEIFNIFHLLSA